MIKDNPRMTAKERNLVKGAIRRVFSRSELRQIVLKSSIVDHSDPKRKRVKTWCRCRNCGRPEAKSNVAVDHKLPVVPLKYSLDQMTWDELVASIWCDPKNLQILCPSCHREKTGQEQKIRAQYKKSQKKG